MPRSVELLRRNGVAVAAVLAVGYVPLVLSGTQLTDLAFVVSAAISLLSLNVLLGYAGQISLGQAAFVGTGGYLALQLGARDVPMVLALIGAGLGVAAITALIGLPSLRIKGLAVAIATLVYGLAAEKWLFAQAWFNGQDKGLFLDAPFTHQDSYSTYLVSFGLLLALLLIDRQLLDSRLGRAMIVTRDGEDRAVAFGVEPGLTKLQAYAMSGFFAGIAGGIVVFVAGTVSAQDYGFVASLEILAFAVVGGVGSRLGMLLAAGLLVGLPAFFPPPNARIAPLVGGIVLVAVILFLPTGFGGAARRVGQAVRRFPYRVRALALTLVLLVGGIVVIVHHRARVDGGDLTSDGPLLLALGSLALVGAAYWLFGRRDGALDAQAEAEAALDTDEGAAARAKQAAHNAVIVRDVPRPLTLRMPTRVMFEARDVGVRFGGVQALKDISLEVRQGEIVGLIGANGAGKSTFYNVVSGFVTPEQGSSLQYKGRELLDAPASVRTTWGIARTFQHMGLVRAQTVQDNVLLAQHWLADYDDWLGTMKLGGAVRTEAELRHRAELALEIFGLEHHLHDRLGSLSYGTMRMVELASAVASGADLLFFDEASAGLAPAEAHSLADRFLALRDELDLTLVVIEHHVPLIARVCDYVYCLASGRQLAEGEPASVQSNPDVVAEFLGRSTIKDDGGQESTGGPDAEQVDASPSQAPAARTAVKKKTAKKTAGKRRTAKKAAKKATKKAARKVAKKSTRPTKRGGSS